MNDSHELIGLKINHITIIEIIRTTHNSITVKGECVCGNVIETTVWKLNNKIKSCGCKKGRLKHGFSHTRLYKNYQGMKERCYNKKNIMYHRYGGRDIRVCDYWLESFENFLEWAKKDYKEGLSLERIDTNGNYEPSNCKWIPFIEQSKNRDKNNLTRSMGKEVLQMDLLTHKVINIFSKCKVCRRVYW